MRMAVFGVLISSMIAIKPSKLDLMAESDQLTAPNSKTGKTVKSKPKSKNQALQRDLMSIFTPTTRFYMKQLSKINPEPLNYILSTMLEDYSERLPGPVLRFLDALYVPWGPENPSMASFFEDPKIRKKYKKLLQTSQAKINGARKLSLNLITGALNKFTEKKIKKKILLEILETTKTKYFGILQAAEHEIHTFIRTQLKDKVVLKIFEQTVSSKKDYISLKKQLRGVEKQYLEARNRADEAASSSILKEKTKLKKKVKMAEDLSYKSTENLIKSEFNLLEQKMSKNIHYKKSKIFKGLEHQLQQKHAILRILKRRRVYTRVLGIRESIERDKSVIVWATKNRERPELKTRLEEVIRSILGRFRTLRKLEAYLGAVGFVKKRIFSRRTVEFLEAEKKREKEVDDFWRVVVFRNRRIHLKTLRVVPGLIKSIFKIRLPKNFRKGLRAPGAHKGVKDDNQSKDSARKGLRLPKDVKKYSKTKSSKKVKKSTKNGKTGKNKNSDPFRLSKRVKAKSLTPKKHKSLPINISTAKPKPTINKSYKERMNELKYLQKRILKKNKLIKFTKSDKANIAMLNKFFSRRKRERMRYTVLRETGVKIDNMVHPPRHVLKKDAKSAGKEKEREKAKKRLKMSKKEKRARKMLKKLKEMKEDRLEDSDGQVGVEKAKKKVIDLDKLKIHQH